MNFKKLLTFVSMLGFSLVMLYPFYFMIETSFKSKEQFLGAPGHSLASWRKLTSAMPVWTQLSNSIIVCTGAIIIILFLSTLAGFSLAKTRFRGTPYFFLGIIGAMLIPLHSVIIPAYEYKSFKSFERILGRNFDVCSLGRSVCHISNDFLFSRITR